MSYVGCCSWASLLIKLINMNGMKKRTSAVGTRHSLHLGRFVSQVENKR